MVFVLRVSKSEPARSQWFKQINRCDEATGKLWAPDTAIFVCSKHFRADNYELPTHGGHRTLKRGVVPTVFETHPAHLQKVQ